MWLRNITAHHYDNEWYKTDEDFDVIGNPGALDSIDENVIAAEEYYSKREEQAFYKQCNLYQQIDKAHGKHMETTEL